MCEYDVLCVGGRVIYFVKNMSFNEILFNLTSLFIFVFSFFSSISSEFLITIIGIETTMDEVATATFSEAMTTVLSPILEELNIALDSVTVTDQQNLGTILDVNVKFSGYYRPPIEQSLGGVIIDAFNTEIQNAFISTLNNQGGEYFSGVQEGGVILALIEDESREATVPTFAPSGSIQIETLPSDNTPPQTSSSVEEEPISTEPQLPTQSPTTSPPPTIAPRELQGPFYLAVLIQNTPYQSKYMDEADFDKFAQVLTSVLNDKLGDALTIEDVTLGYQQLIQVGSGTATEVNLSYEVASSLASSQIESMVSRAVGRNRKEIISLLQDDLASGSYFLEIGEMQAQSITQFGDPTSTATLPDIIPVKPTPSPTPLPPPEVVVDEQPEADQNQGEEDSNAQVAEPVWTGPTAAELLAEEEAKKNQAGVSPTAVEPIDEPGGSNGGGE